jgi:hypothetical protein
MLHFLHHRLSSVLILREFPLPSDASVRLCGDRLIGVVSGAVGEDVVDEHSDDGEEEDNESPDDFVSDGAVALEDLDCGTNTSA